MKKRHYIKPCSGYVLVAGKIMQVTATPEFSGEDIDEFDGKGEQTFETFDTGISLYKSKIWQGIEEEEEEEEYRKKKQL